jgi:hypothetical protein
VAMATISMPDARSLITVAGAVFYNSIVDIRYSIPNACLISYSRHPIGNSSVCPCLPPILATHSLVLTDVAKQGFVNG